MAQREDNPRPSERGWLEAQNEPSLHSWRPAAPNDTQEPLQDGVHLPSSARRAKEVTSETERPEPTPRDPEPKRFTAAGLVCAVSFGVALLVVFIVRPEALLRAYVAVPAVLIAGALVYYIRRAQHNRPKEFELQRAHGNGRWKR